MTHFLRRIHLHALALTVALAGFLMLRGELDATVPATHAEETTSDGARPKLAPLKVDRSAPLLLLDAPKSQAPKSKDGQPVADNEACYVCHGDYREETMVLEHVVANVGCVRCHGASAAHRDDEDNVTPPDVMYPAAAIDSACNECHDTHDAPARKVIARWQERCPEKSDLSQLVCTDCHGHHRRPFRTVQWDKTTRKLLVKNDPAKKPTGTAPGNAESGVEEMK